MGIKDLLGQTYCLLRLSRTLSKLNAFIEGARSLQNEEWPMAGPLVCLDGGFYLLYQVSPFYSFSVNLACWSAHKRNLKK